MKIFTFCCIFCFFYDPLMFIVKYMSSSMHDGNNFLVCLRRVVQVLGSYNYIDYEELK